jgi:hypothetical protein
MWRELIRDWQRLVAGWWRVDQIRISPDEGRLLRLQPSSLVVVGGRPAEVLSRTVGHDVGGTFVVYECRSARGDCRLTVRIVGERAAVDVLWSDDGVEQTLPRDAVETFTTRSPRSFTRDELTAASSSTYSGKID